MTRKDYELIAGVIKRETHSHIHYTTEQRHLLDRRLAILHDTASQLARMFAHDNPRFDRDRFLKACGVYS